MTPITEAELPEAPAQTRVVEAAVDALLPQTQCGRCGYDGCRPYARAIADGVADINRCSPGGEQTIINLSSLLGRPRRPLAADVEPTGAAAIAVIVEAECIGCARCLPACPVDAIIGAVGMMHEIQADACTGCELCLASCPMDCIHMTEPAAD